MDKTATLSAPHRLKVSASTNGKSAEVADYETPHSYILPSHNRIVSIGRWERYRQEHLETSRYRLAQNLLFEGLLRANISYWTALHAAKDKGCLSEIESSQSNVFDPLLQGN